MAAKSDSRAQDLVHDRDVFKKLRPIHRGQQAHARDDVSHRRVHRGLLLMFQANDLFGRRASERVSCVIEPFEGRRHAAFLIAQPHAPAERRRRE